MCVFHQNIDGKYNECNKKWVNRGFTLHIPLRSAVASRKENKIRVKNFPLSDEAVGSVQRQALGADQRGRHTQKRTAYLIFGEEGFQTVVFFGEFDI